MNRVAVRIISSQNENNRGKITKKKDIRFLIFVIFSIGDKHCKRGPFSRTIKEDR